ncbi:MAG: carbohydrate ABC transporter substrate-binding protein [Erysipelotrichaceae bacterium]|nr:carbohydrate ABC transporter substrate-binding protein [Erysipelotrichaceae bacterium]
MKKVLICLLSVVMLLALVGCSGDGSSNNNNKKPNQEIHDNPDANTLAGVNLEVAVNFTGDAQTAFAAICSNFENRYGATVTVDWYGSDHATLMTTRMAANNMPDVYVTAGWSIKKYKDYSLDLRDEPYCKDYTDSALGVIKDKDGSIYVCMVSEGINGVVYNVNVCKEAGVDYLSIHTWDDLWAACEKIKEAGFTPIASRPNAGMTSNAVGTWLTYEGEVANVGDKLLDGTWNWEEYRYVLDAYGQAVDKGYFFADAKSMNEMDTLERLASGRAGIIIGDNTASVQTMYEMNSKGDFAIGPFPASTEEGVEAITVGEGDAFAISKNSKNIDAAKIFLRYLAEEEVTRKLISATGRKACQESVLANDDTDGTKAFLRLEEEYADHKMIYANIFDREYLPAGMFGILGNVAGKIFAGRSEADKKEAISYLKENFDRLYKETKQQ